MLTLLGYLVQIAVFSLYFANISGIEKFAEAFDKIKITYHTVLNDDIVQIFKLKRIPDISHKVQDKYFYIVFILKCRLHFKPPSKLDISRSDRAAALSEKYGKKSAAAE